MAVNRPRRYNRSRSWKGCVCRTLFCPLSSGTKMCSYRFPSFWLNRYSPLLSQAPEAGSGAIRRFPFAFGTPEIWTCVVFILIISPFLCSPAVGGLKLQLMSELQQDLHASERVLLKRMDLSLGKANYCVRAVIEKGWVKAGNFGNSNKKTA